MNGPITQDPWNEIEMRLLAAVQTPCTTREVITATGLPADTVKAQLDLLRRDGRVIDEVHDGVRYQLTLTGRRRLHALSRPSHQAAA